MPIQIKVQLGRYYRYTGSKPAWMNGRLVRLNSKSRDSAFVATWMPSKGRPSIIEDEVPMGNLAWLTDEEQPVAGQITVDIDPNACPAMVATPPRRLKQV